MAKFCENCGAGLHESARFCPQCGVAIGGFLPQNELSPQQDCGVSNRKFIIEEYSYETHKNLFPWSAIIAISIFGLMFGGIGLAVALTEGFWIMFYIMGGIPLLAIFIVMLSHKGRQKKWGKERTLWIFTREGFASGPPPEVAAALGAIGAASTVASVAGPGRPNAAVTMLGLGMMDNLKYIKGLPVMPWEAFAKAEYRPERREIVMHAPTGRTTLIHANPDNYAYVEQLVRGYMGGR